jgi:tryptophan 7-halogenase
MTRPLKKMIILGGGSAGWMTAAALGKILNNQLCEVQLIESDDIGTIGVGEATIPQLMVYNKLIGLDENEFIRETKGSFKLGIQFTDWDKIGNSYFHAFGDLGKNMEGVQFYHYWLKMRAQGKAEDLDHYSLSSTACNENRFMRPIDAGNSPLSNIAYAFHFDAGLYAKYLRKLSEGWGVKRTEGKVAEVMQHENGNIKSLIMENGDEHSADFFIDCSGFKGLLINETLGSKFECYKKWLPCDRAVAVASETDGKPWPFTRAAAQKAGWQWRIPLQHRTGNGHVYCSDFMSDEEAKQILLSNLDAPAIGEPRLIKFKTGHRKEVWKKNCMAIGLSAGFIEPMESTALHLIQTGISKLFAFFPHQDHAQADIDEYNRQMAFEFEAIRDFLVAHYYVSKRDDSDFWNHMRTMEIPESLQLKLDQFTKNGRVFRYNNELFNDVSWFEVLYGQGMRPESYHALVDVFPEEELHKRLEGIKNVIRKSADYMPQHIDFIKEQIAR